MINPQELRIGNWVLLDTCHAPCAPHKIQANDIVSIFFGLPKGVTIDPLPLSPEILEKARFKFKPKGEEVYGQIWENNGFEIWQHDEGFCHDYLNGGDLDSLHQLQNLVHSLTGKELEVTL